MDDPVERKTDLFKDPKLQPGPREGFEILQGRRVYHEGSPYPFEGRTPYFKVDAYLLRHRLSKGGQSGDIRREVFERGDSVGVLLFNRDTRQVLVVEQFRLPTVERGKGNGWIVETVSGEIKEGENPKESAIRETFEETGYQISDPELIAEFFSSPGGTSEKIHLFFAEVSDVQKIGAGGGRSTEDIKVVPYTLDALAAKLRNRELVDPKLVIASYYLQARLGLRVETDDPIDSGQDPARFVWKKHPGVTIGIKTGDVLKCSGVDIWLNPENRYMMMSRIIDGGLSASIRWGGAHKYRNLAVATDTIGNALRVAMGGRAEAKDTEIIETDPGELHKLGVKRLLHLPIAEADGEFHAREGLRVERRNILPLLKAALRHADDGEHGAHRIAACLKGRWSQCSSVLIPLIGAGEGGITPHHCVPDILKGIGEFLDEHPKTCLREFYLLAFWKRELDVCKAELEKFEGIAKLTS